MKKRRIPSWTYLYHFYAALVCIQENNLENIKNSDTQHTSVQKFFTAAYKHWSSFLVHIEINNDMLALSFHHYSFTLGKRYLTHHWLIGYLLIYYLFISDADWNKTNSILTTWAVNWDKNWKDACYKESNFSCTSKLGKTQSVAVIHIRRVT